MASLLTPLQRAYLLGRGPNLPLGGVAMQEFREYRGHIAATTLRCRLTALVARHDSLRTSIDEATLTQRVSAEPHVNLDEIDLTGLPRAEALRRIDALREDYAHQLHDLARPPWHMLMFHLPAPETASEDGCVVFVRFDALILDGRSIARLMIELFGTAEPEPRALLPPSTAAEATDAARQSADAAYWTQKLHAVTGPPRLPWKTSLHSLKTARYGRASRTIPRESLATLGRIGAAHSLFRNTMLTALILEVLSRWTEDGALTAGLPVAPPTGRMDNSSTFICLTYDTRTSTFEARARQLQADTLEGLAHLSFSGVDIARLLLSRDPESVALPVVITNGLSWDTLEPGSPMRLFGGLTQTPQVAMDLRLARDEGGNLVLSVDHAREAVDGDVVAHLLDAFARAVDALCRRGALEIAAADMIDMGHYRHNGTDGDFACSGFLARIARNLSGGSKDALICGERRISYADLGRDVVRIMGGLEARGLGAGQVVAICLPRSPEHVMLTLACSLRGIIWVPVDVSAPEERRRYLLENCRPDLVVSASPVPDFPMAAPAELLAASPTVPDFPLEALATRSRSEAPAYYLYTSGTTGKPKCVVLSNRATSNVIRRTLEAWAVTAADVFISVTPLHHDMSVFDLFGSLAAGATLVIPTPEAEKDAIAWNRLVATHGVSIWCSVPAILEMLLSCRQGDTLGPLRLVAQGGDYIKPAVIAQLRQFSQPLRLISLGGPTETTIWSIWHEITEADADVIPYGRPLPGIRYFVLNEAGEHCPPHVVGRIHTAGVNTALGYLEDGTLHQTDFVWIGDEAGRPVRAFRTGDRGYYRTDGTLIFASRVNGYVKVRGIRVSLPDIETELARHPALRQVLAVDYGSERNGDVGVGILYVAEGRSAIPVADLRAFARKHLPESHVPTRFLQIDALPLSANGKPDRHRARALLSDSSEPQTKMTAASLPARPHSDRIAEIYRSIIDAPSRPGAGSAAVDFLAMGLRPSHLKTIAIRLNAEFDVALSPAALVRCRNAAQVAQLLEGKA